MAGVWRAAFERRSSVGRYWKQDGERSDSWLPVKMGPDDEILVSQTAVFC